MFCSYGQRDTGDTAPIASAFRRVALPYAPAYLTFAPPLALVQLHNLEVEGERDYTQQVSKMRW